MVTAAVVVFIVKFWPAIIGVIGLSGAALFGWLKTKPSHRPDLQTFEATLLAPKPGIDLRDAASQAKSGKTQPRSPRKREINEGAGRL
ncbi:hypothetical protein B0G77_3652 [Paraburkholderia sp. BL10I2N1]|nr:hypothetical protein B0G77_3652 [Paraburkholderia sp. BL10I2N1]